MPEIPSHLQACSFCGRQKAQVNLLIAPLKGKPESTYRSPLICDFCVTAAFNQIQEQRAVRSFRIQPNPLSHA